MTQVEKLIKYLQKERIKNIHLINSLIRKEVKSIIEYNNSYLIEYKKGKYSIYGNDKDSILQLISKLPKQNYAFSSVEEWIYNIIKKDKKIIWKEKIYRYHLPNNISLPKIKNNISNITQEDIEIINNTWTFKSENSSDYIRERVIEGPSAIIKINNEPVSWGLLHNNGAIGFLYTKKEFRRKGFSQDILIYIINKIRESNNIPFLYIVAGNNNSIKLTDKLGFINDGKYFWSELKF